MLKGARFTFILNLILKQVLIDAFNAFSLVLLIILWCSEKVNPLIFFPDISIFLTISHKESSDTFQGRTEAIFLS